MRILKSTAPLENSLTISYKVMYFPCDTAITFWESIQGKLKFIYANIINNFSPYNCLKLEKTLYIFQWMDEEVNCGTSTQWNSLQQLKRYTILIYATACLNLKAYSISSETLILKIYILEFPMWHSGLKIPPCPHLWCRSQLWLRIDLWDLHMSRVRPKKKKKFNFHNFLKKVK